MAYYAWSPIVTKRNEQGMTTETIQPGDTVAQKAAGLSDADWEYLLETGVIREEEYPENLDMGQAPAEKEREQVQAMYRGELDPDEVEEIQIKLGTADPATLEATSGKQTKASAPEPEDITTTVEAKKAGG